MVTAYTNAVAIHTGTDMYFTWWAKPRLFTVQT